MIIQKYNKVLKTTNKSMLKNISVPRVVYSHRNTIYYVLLFDLCMRGNELNSIQLYKLRLQITTFSVFYYRTTHN